MTRLSFGKRSRNRDGFRARTKSAFSCIRGQDSQETLAQRLKKGALPLDQALTYAIEIADALDKAQIILVQNWYKELKRLVPTDR